MKKTIDERETHKKRTTEKKSGEGSRSYSERVRALS